jgi:hypothetical protein
LIKKYLKVEKVDFIKSFWLIEINYYG